MHVMNRLFGKWSEMGIRYAHFKSNENLNYSFNDNGDFDVLVDPLRSKDVFATLNELGAKQTNTIPEKHYPGVDNWLLFDDESGRIHHLHLHFQIMSGKPYVKDYEIPFRDIILDSRIFNEQWQIYVSNPNVELILLTVRLVIKSHFSDLVKSFVGAYRTYDTLQKEREGLLKIVSSAEVENYLEKIFGTEYTHILKRIILSDYIGSADFRRLSHIVRDNFKSSRRVSAFKGSVRSMRSTLHYFWLRVIKKMGYFTISKKTSLSSGAIIAFVGVDGSGKSTTEREIYKWLSKQFDCSRVYMGLGDGKTAPLATILKKGRRLIGSGSFESNESINSKNYVKREPITFFKNPKYYIRKRLLISTIYSVEKNNYNNFIRMNRYRINGGISVLDRYPQIELPNQNDGPKIEAYKDLIKAEGYISRMTKKEISKLSIVRTIKPDVIFRLNISAEESMRRKPDQKDISIVQGKIDDLNRITFQGARIEDINAMQPYEQEIIEIKRIIWNLL